MLFLKKTTHIVGYFFQTLEFPEKYFIGNEKHQIVCFDIFSFFEFCKKISKNFKKSSFLTPQAVRQRINVRDTSHQSSETCTLWCLQGFYFLQTFKAQNQGFYFIFFFLQTLKAQNQGFYFLQTLNFEKYNLESIVKMKAFLQKFLHRWKIFKKVQSEGFWLSQNENHVICCISKNNQQCSLLFWNTWISTKNIIGCLEIRFHSYLLNLHDLLMWFEYLHIIKGINVRFHSYLLNRHDLHMQFETPGFQKI